VLLLCLLQVKFILKHNSRLGEVWKLSGASTKTETAALLAASRISSPSLCLDSCRSDTADDLQLHATNSSCTLLMLGCLVPSLL
jgi:hypothetical protein